MKKILQAIDGIKATTEVPSSETKKVLPITESTTAFKKYVQQVEQELTEGKNRKQERADQLAEAVKQRLDPKCWKGKHKEGTKIKGGVRVNNCVPNESIEESSEGRCMQCGMKNCKCPGDSCKCKPVAGWVPGKGFKKAMDEAANPAQQAAIAIAKKKKAGIKENASIGTMPTTEYVKGIYAAAAENGMGAPEINAVKKQMVLAPNGEVDIMATMQKALQVFQSPAWKQMIADLDALVKQAEQQGVKEGDLIPYPAGTVKVDVSDVYDWYKLGQHISNLDKAKASEFGKGPPQTILAFGSEPEEHKYFKNLKRLGLKTHDLDPPGYKDVDEVALSNTLQWPEVVNKINSAMKATGWKGKRQGDDAFMFSTKGQLDDEFYIVIIENAGKGFFSYALGTVEEGDPYIDDAYKGKLPNTEASVSELINDIRDGFGLSEGVPRLSKHISQSKLPPDSLNRRAKNQAIKRLK